MAKFFNNSHPMAPHPTIKSLVLAMALANCVPINFARGYILRGID
jgi:hypothetical protein